MKFPTNALRRSLLGCLSATGALASAHAATLYDSGGFESPVFLLEQSLDGQDPAAPAGNGPWNQDNGTSTAVVTATNAIDGTKSVKITRAPGATGNTRWGVVKSTSPAIPNNVVEISFDMKLIQKPYEYGPLFGIEAYDGSSGTPKLIGSLLHDASTGELLCHQSGTGAFVGTGFYPSRQRHQHYRLALNFTARTYSVYANNRLVRTEGFVDPTATTFTDAPLVTLESGADGDAGAAYIDNYRIEQTTSQLPYLTWRGDGAANVWANGGATNWDDGIGQVPFANGQAVRFNDGGSTIPAIQLQGSLLPASVRVSGSRSYTFAGSGSINGATGLTKEGEGTLTLSSANGYSGNTEVADGELSVRNASGSATGTGTVSLASRSTLSGDGRIGGIVTIAPGGVVEPGAGVGTLRVNSLVMDEALLKFELGSTSDKLAVTGDLTLSGSLQVRDAGGFGPGTYPLISHGGALTTRTFVLTDAPAGFDYKFSTATAGVISLVVSLPPPAPSAPDGLAATAASTSAISLTWNDRSEYEDQFVVERSEGGMSFGVIGSTGANVTTFIDSGLASGKTYSYRVRAQNSSGPSGYSNEASARTLISPPLAYLKFDETSGTTAFDSSPNGNNGALVGGPVFAPGQIENAVDLDGTDDHVTLPTGVVKSLSDFTIASWVKLDVVANWSRVFDFGASTSTYMFLSPRNGANGKVRFAITTGGGAGEQIIEGPSALPAGVWTHVAVTLSGGTGTLYINGTAVGSNPTMTLKPSSLGATANNYIGRSQYADPYLNGQIDEFQILSRALSQAEVASLADLNTPRAPTGLVVTGGDGQVDLSWNAVDGATSYTVYRSTGSGYTMLATGLTSPDFSDTGLTNGTSYSYVVTASNAFGESSFSAAREVIPYPQAEYSGRAIVISLNVLGSAMNWGDTGELPTEGGSRESSFLTVDEAGLVAGDTGHAMTIGQADRTRSEASVSALVLSAGGIVIEADFLMARALAVYQTGGTTGLAGGSEIGGLTVAGAPVEITGEANQTVNLPNGKLVINEQITTDTSITVNALHVTVDGGGDIVIASARAGYDSIELPVISGDDRLSGGGWILLNTGGKGYFGVSAGYGDGVLSGKFTYRNGDTGMQVKSTGVAAYLPGSTPNSRRIEGSAEIDGASGFTYVIEAADNGEPGDADIFKIELSNGFHADGVLGGGNIQLHLPGK